MSTPDSPYQPGGYQPPQYQEGQYQQGQYGYGQYGYGQNPQAGPYGPMPQGPYMQPGYGFPFGPGNYLGGGGVGFGDAIKLAFQNAFMYQGRASRSAYWWFALFSFIVSVAVGVIFGGIAGHGAGGAAGFLVVDMMLSLVMLLVSLPLFIRRLHDIDRSGWWLLIGLVPIVGVITLFVFTLLDGTPGPNRFG
jgi:uncharacterized membrane protein YhaH (DUF805 family)